MSEFLELGPGNNRFIYSGPVGQNVDGQGGNDIIIGGSADDNLLGGEGNDQLQGRGGTNLLDGGGGNDLIFAKAGDTVIGGTGNDELRITDNLNSYTSFTFDPGTKEFVATGAGGAKLTATDVETIRFVANSGTGVFKPDTVPGVVIVCYAEGTRILTSRGEVPVETLRGGDLVVTLSGRGAPLVPVKWVGRRHVEPARLSQPELAQPVVFAADSLGDGVPARELRVSPEHHMWVDGALVPAHLLVNGTTIRRAEVASVTYYGVECASHEVLVADGAPAESYLDCGNRQHFDNAPVRALYQPEPAFDAAWDAARAVGPRVAEGAALAAIRARPTERAAALLGFQATRVTPVGRRAALASAASPAALLRAG
jgi:hypothetical protein